jgi:WD40 repeat protein
MIREKYDFVEMRMRNKIKIIQISLSFMVAILTGCSSSLPTRNPQAESIPTVNDTTVLRHSATVMPTEQLVQSDLCIELAENGFSPSFFNDRLVQIDISPNLPLRVLLTPDEMNLLIMTPEGVFSTALVDGKTRCMNGGHDYSPTSLAVDPVRDQWVVNTLDGKINFLDTQTGAPLRIYLNRNTDWVPHAWNQISSDGSTMVSFGSFTTIRLWNLLQGSQILETKGDLAAISADNSRLAVSGKDFLQWIDVDSGEVLRTVVNENTRDNTIIYILFDGTGKYLYTLSAINELLVWDVESGDVVREIHLCSECKDIEKGWEVESPRLSLSTDGKRLLVSDPNGVIVWDTTTWNEVFYRYDYWDEPVTDATMSNKGDILVVSLQDGTIFVSYPDDPTND